MLESLLVTSGNVGQKTFVHETPSADGEEFPTTVFAKIPVVTMAHDNVRQEFTRINLGIVSTCTLGVDHAPLYIVTNEFTEVVWRDMNLITIIGKESFEIVRDKGALDLSKQSAAVISHDPL